jgi:hypothetical protein
MMTWYTTATPDARFHGTELFRCDDNGANDEASSCQDPYADHADDRASVPARTGDMRRAHRTNPRCFTNGGRQRGERPGLQADPDPIASDIWWSLAEWMLGLLGNGRNREAEGSQDLTPVIQELILPKSSPRAICLAGPGGCRMPAEPTQRRDDR